MNRRILLVALSILLAIPLLGLGVPAPVPVTLGGGITTLTLVSGGGLGGYGTPDPITTYSIVGGSSGQAFIVSPNAVYTVIPGTRWLNTTGVAITGGSDQATNKTTNYVASFTLPQCYKSPSIAVQILADNAATLFLNGTQFGQQPQSIFVPNYQVISTFTSSVASDFRPGVNTLMIADADFGFSNGVDFQAVVTYSSGFKFKGFFEPIENPGPGSYFEFNKVEAGSGIPVKFSLCGNQGLDIFAANYPSSEKVSCDGAHLEGDIQPTLPAGSSGLTFDDKVSGYRYGWKTDKAWAGSCRKLTVRLTDGTDHIAYFHFFKQNDEEERISRN